MTCAHTPADIQTACEYGNLCPLCMLAHIKRLETALHLVKSMPAAGSWKETAHQMRDIARAALRPIQK